MTKADIATFLADHNLAVIATVSEAGSPEAAALEFASTPELELVIDTFTTSRKFANIKANAKVAFVIGWDDNVTLQYEGVASVLAGDEAKEARDIYLKMIPKAVRWIDSPDVVLLKIKPTWARMTDLNQHPWKIDELKFS